MTHETSQQYVHADGLEVHESDDGLIVFNPATDRVHHLNHTAGVIFELCESPILEHHLLEQVVKLYSLESTQQESITTGLQQLLDEGVLSVSAST